MLFDRVASLVIGKDGKQGRELTGLRFAFSIEKQSTKAPNKCTLKVWNLAPETRGLVEAIGNVLILKAGYVQDTGAQTIFQGDVIRALTVREGPDWVTELEMQDGHKEFRDTKASVSYGRGATALQVLGDLSKRFGLPVRELPADVAAKQYPNGFSFVGRLRDAMEKACDYLKLEWSIQNREIQIIKKGGVFQKRAVVLSSDTGMVESPMLESKTMTEKAAAKDGITASQPGVRATTQRNDDGEIERVLQVNGYKVKSLLQPSLEPGGYVQLKSKSIDGQFFRIEELTHVGDTFGSEWHTNITLRFV